LNAVGALTICASVSWRVRHELVFMLLAMKIIDMGQSKKNRNGAAAITAGHTPGMKTYAAVAIIPNPSPTLTIVFISHCMLELLQEIINKYRAKCCSRIDRDGFVLEV
jgi:hypothetical protein